MSSGDAQNKFSHRRESPSVLQSSQKKKTNEAGVLAFWTLAAVVYLKTL